MANRKHLQEAKTSIKPDRVFSLFPDEKEKSKKEKKNLKRVHKISLIHNPL